ncbi:hypothetical protein ABGB14_11540 [Nonomuraea sp. B10E15]|uniref:hypothetical protein n=1 Tax=Nonomuraea sp. B10E15 TaxID=3153560 RepID=UPI00325D154D
MSRKLPQTMTRNLYLTRVTAEATPDEQGRTVDLLASGIDDWHGQVGTQGG